MKAFSRKFFGQSGMSLVEVTIAAALAGGLALVIAQIGKNSGEVSKRADTKFSVNSLKGQIASRLSDSTACENTLGSTLTAANLANANLTGATSGTGITLVNAGVTEKGSTNVWLSKTSKFGEVTLTDMRLRYVHPTNQSGEFVATGTYKLSGKTVAIKPIIIPLNLNTISGGWGASSSCSAAGNFDNIWVAMSLGEGIEYAGGGVKVGTGTVGLAGGSIIAFSAGSSNTATGANSTTLGSYNQATGQDALAIGGGNAGLPNIASGTQSFAGGVDSQATANYSFSFGVTNRANAYQSIVFGTNNTTVSGATRSILLGSYLSSTNADSMTMGDGNSTVLTNAVQNGFAARYSGGYRFFSDAAQTIAFRINPNGGLSSSTSTTTMQGSGAFGQLNTNAAHNSFAFGYDNDIINAAYYSSAFGMMNQLNNAVTFAVGQQNTLNGTYGFAAGSSNTVTGNYSSVLGHSSSTNGANAVALGYNVSAAAQGAFALGDSSPLPVAPMTNSTANALKARFAGGYTFYNDAAQTEFFAVAANGGISSGTSTVAGDNAVSLGTGNSSTGSASVSIGYSNTVSGNYSTGIGRSNNASGADNVAIGYANVTSNVYATAIGRQATATMNAAALGLQANAGANAAVAVGYLASATGNYSSAFGHSASATAQDATAIGYGSIASGQSAVAVGLSATASGSRSIALGANNGGTTAAGASSFAVGHNATTNVAGDSSVAIGTNATAAHSTSMIIAQSPWATASTSAANRITMMAVGGIEVCTNGNPCDANRLLYSGGGGGWVLNSDKNLKEDFKEIDENLVMTNLSELDITTWLFKEKYAGRKGLNRRIGPMAQDFYRLFSKPLNLDSTDKQLSPNELYMVGLVATKGLIKQVGKLENENKELKRKIATLETRLEQIEESLSKKR